ncbi:MAG: hypothetical protein EXR98_02445 [Gemmataceae bacterium]|nr:hypothetical protein [Gemmataceae bacterium]
MECQDVKQLLAFADRKCAELDAPELDSLKQHLETCPTCAEAAQAERALDDAVGPVLRDVAVPADLKAKVLKRLAAERGAVPWKRVLAAAAAILIAVTGGVVWLNSPATAVSEDELRQFVSMNQWTQETAKQFLKDQGLVGLPPDNFEYGLLQHVDVIRFQGRLVGKLTFSRGDECTASVLILPWKQFSTKHLTENPTSLSIRHDDVNEVTYLILFRGNLDALRPKPPIT